MITLKTAKSQLQIIPSLGGTLANLQLFNGKESISILDSYESADDANAKAGYKSHFLLPFPNRMKDGKYTFEGEKYQFPVNDTNTNNNLHGFLETLPMEITKKEEKENRATINLKGTFEGLPYYPFPFSFFVTYNLTDSQLTIQIKIKNRGNTKMPIGFGWHPYFKLGTQKVNDLKMQFPDCQIVKSDERMMPTGKTSAYTTFSKLETIGNTNLDNCFKLNHSDSKKVRIRLKSETVTLNVWQQTDMFPYFQIYTPDHRQSIAIEPMTCNVDAFNNENGLWILDEKEERKIEFGVEMI